MKRFVLRGSIPASTAAKLFTRRRARDRSNGGYPAQWQSSKTLVYDGGLNGGVKWPAILTC